MLKLLTFMALSCLVMSGAAQNSRGPEQLSQKIKDAGSDAERIGYLTELAEYYSVFNLSAKSDSVLQKALMIAEVSEDKTVFVKTMLNKNLINLNSWSNEANFQKALKLMQAGVQYAVELQNPELEALAYIRLAAIYRRKHMYEEAMQQTTHAITALSDTKGGDSVRVELFCELGDIYSAKSDPVPACRNYNNAYEIAYRKKDVRSQSMIYRRFSDLYRSFNALESSKKYLLESLRLNIDNENAEGQFLDYIGLAKITNEKAYIEKAAAVAQTLNSVKYRIQAKTMMFYWYMVEGKDSKITWDYLQSNPDLLLYFNNQGPSALTWEKGNIYKYAGKYDSALIFYREAEPVLLANGTASAFLNVYSTLGETYLQNKDSVKGREYMLKTFEEARKLEQLPLWASVSTDLGNLAAKHADYRMAYYYAMSADTANKLLQSKAAKDKIALLEIDRENKKSAADLLEKQQSHDRKFNLQIMAITLVITAFFVFLLFIGMFEVNKTSIKTLGYFAFISLFEFIVLLLDHPIIALTKGLPLRLWLVKICLIAMLVPIQHYLEKNMIKFLQSRKLTELRQKLSVKNMMRKKSRPVVDESNNEELEEGTAVL